MVLKLALGYLIPGSTLIRSHYNEALSLFLFFSDIEYVVQTVCKLPNHIKKY